MTAFITAVYGLVVYVLFLATFLYAVAFVGGIPLVPKTIDSGAVSSPVTALAINLFALTLFALQHSVMARPAFKRWWTRFVPPVAERSTYVLFASLVLALVFVLWRPLPQIVWQIADPVGVLVVQAVFWLGWAVLLISTFLINHFELFGLKQTFVKTGHDAVSVSAPLLRTPLFYRYVRHPIYLGFLLAFWAAPTMTAGHLLFAIGTTGYILLGIALEERDLVDQFGDAYRRYRERVGMLLPRVFRRERSGSTQRSS